MQQITKQKCWLRFKRVSKSRKREGERDGGKLFRTLFIKLLPQTFLYVVNKCISNRLIQNNEMKSGNQVEWVCIDFGRIWILLGSLRFHRKQSNFAFAFSSFGFLLLKHLCGSVIISTEDYTILMALQTIK